MPSGDLVRYNITGPASLGISAPLFSSLNSGSGIQTRLSGSQSYFAIESSYQSDEPIASFVGIFFPGSFSSLGIPLGNLAVWTVEGTGDIINLNAVAGPPPGTTAANPLLPEKPQADNQSWIFEPVIVRSLSQVWWFDPEVAMGYIYTVQDSAGPLFDQFIAPDLPFNNTYEIFSSSNNICSASENDYDVKLATITQDNPYSFSVPLQCFAIKGIDVRNTLDPVNTSAFMAGISFDKAGIVSVRQTPILTPGPLPVLGVSAAFGFARCLRQRLLKSKD